MNKYFVNTILLSTVAYGVVKYYHSSQKDKNDDETLETDEKQSEKQSEKQHDLDMEDLI